MGVEGEDPSMHLNILGFVLILAHVAARTTHHGVKGLKQYLNVKSLSAHRAIEVTRIFQASPEGIGPLHMLPSRFV